MSLITEFEKYGLTQYIPRFTSSAMDDASEYLLQRGEYEDRSYYGAVSNRRDAYEPDFDAMFYEYEYEKADEEDDRYEWGYGYVTENSIFNSIGELKQYLGYDYLEDEDFLAMHLNDLFDLTPNQMKFLNIDIVTAEDFPLARFLDLLKDSTVQNKFPDAERRIKYCTVSVRTNLDIQHPLRLFPHEMFPPEVVSALGTAPDDPVIVEYVERIIFKHDINKAVFLLNLLNDYYLCRPFAIVIDMERKENGLSPFGYPLTPKPSHIKDYHDKAARDYNTYHSKLSKQQEQEYNEAIAVIKKTPAYKRLLYKSDQYEIIAPEYAADIRHEGEVLDHCVASYIPQFAAGTSYLYFLRKTAEPDKPYFTIEVKDENNKYVLTQCYTYKDHTDKPESCKEFIVEWARKKRLRIGCEI